MFQAALEEGYDVDAEIAVWQSVIGYVLLGGGDDVVLFAAVDPFGGVAEFSSSGAFDFDEDDEVVFAGDQVDFLMPGLPGSFEDFIAVIGQVFFGEFFIFAPAGA